MTEEKILQQQLEDKYHQTIANFKQRWLHKDVEISRAGLYNYAMSIMRYEFHKAFDEETSKRLVESYKP